MRFGHVADGETSRRSLAFDFLPGAGGGDRGARSCTNSVSSGERGAVSLRPVSTRMRAAAIQFVKGERPDDPELADFWQTAT